MKGKEYEEDFMDVYRQCVEGDEPIDIDERAEYERWTQCDIGCMDLEDLNW